MDCCHDMIILLYMLLLYMLLLLCMSMLVIVSVVSDGTVGGAVSNDPIKSLPL